MPVNGGRARAHTATLRQRLRIEGSLSDTASGQDAVYGALSILPNSRITTNDHIYKDRLRLLGEAISAFHRSGNFPLPYVSLENLPLFRVTHQPNFLAGLNVTGAALLLSSLNAKDNCTVYTFVDYATAQDPRLRAAHIPIGFDHTSILHSPIPRADRNSVTYALMPPSPKSIEQWIKLLRYSSRVTERQLRQASVSTRHPKEAQHLLDEMRDLWLRFLRKATSIGEFYAFVTVDLLRRVAGGNIGGASGEHILQIAGHSMAQTIRQDLAPRGLVTTTDWWLVCDQCNRRIPCTWNWSTGKTVAICTKCGRLYLGMASFGTKATSENGRIIPRVRADVLLEYAWLPAQAHGSYGGSLGHLIRSRAAATRAGLHVPPELIWDPVELIAFKPALTPLGAGADLLARGRAPLLCYYLLFPPGQLMEALVDGSHVGLARCQAPIATIVSNAT